MPENALIPCKLQMVKGIYLKSVAFCLLVIFLRSVLGSHHAHGAFLYKSYLVLQDRGEDILCDPYIVKKNDYVLKLFRQKGEMSHKDFPEFLKIFKRINPHVRDINTIRPNQRIFIPLKKLKPGALPGQSSGIVTIPFVTIKKIDEVLGSYSTEYKVQKGDSVSILVARRYGRYGSESYREGIKLFRMFNSDISDLDLIYEGQTVHIPDPSIRDQTWYRSLLEGTAPSGMGTNQSNLYAASQQEEVVPPEPSRQQIEESVPILTSSPFKQASDVLEAKLLSKGAYFFPREEKEDFKLDLSRFPVMRFKEKTVIFCTEPDLLSKSEADVIKSHWNNLEVAQVPANPSAEQILDSVIQPTEETGGEQWFSFSDQGIKVEIRAKWITETPTETGKPADLLCIMPIDRWDERTIPSIRNYLQQHNIVIKNFLRSSRLSDQNFKAEKSNYSVQYVATIAFSDRKAFVEDFAGIIGCNYAENVTIMFPYAGIQVRASLNLISTRDGKEVLVDFGDLYGDAIQSIEKTGFKIIQILEKDDLPSIMVRLMEAVSIPFTVNPSFTAAKSQGPYYARLTIPGFLIEKGGKSKILLASVPLHDRIVQFLQEQGILIMRIESMEKR